MGGSTTRVTRCARRRVEPDRALPDRAAQQSRPWLGDDPDGSASLSRNMETMAGSSGATDGVFGSGERLLRDRVATMGLERSCARRDRLHVVIGLEHLHEQRGTMS